MRIFDVTLGLVGGFATLIATTMAFGAFGRTDMLAFSISASVAVVVAVLVASHRRKLVPAHAGGVTGVAAVVAAGLAVVVNRLQLAKWPGGCRDVFILPSPASASCAPPNLTDVPLPWLGPLVGFVSGAAVLTWWLRRGTVDRTAEPVS